MKAGDAINQSMSRVMADRVQSSYIPSVSARPAMEADLCYDSASSPGVEQADPQTPPHYNVEPEKEFILKYESLPQLWDTSDIRYSNRFERYRALGQLLPTYQKIKPYGTIDDIKKKINSLRSNYRRELKKYILSAKTGGSIVYYPKVWYFPYLNFLRKLENDVDQDESTPGVEKTENPENNQEQISTKPKSILQSLCLEPKPRSPLPTLKMRKKIYQDKFRTNHYLPHPYQYQHQCPKISNPLALEWSQTLARLDPLQRLYAKKAINDVLFEAELGSLHKHSVRINDSSSYYIPTSPGHMSDGEELVDPPSSSIQKSDPISFQNNDSTSDVDCKFPVTFLHCNLENDDQARKTEFSD